MAQSFLVRNVSIRSWEVKVNGSVGGEYRAGRPEGIIEPLYGRITARGTCRLHSPDMYAGVLA